MPVKGLPPSPNLDHLKYQAKDLLKGHSSKDIQTAQRVREFHPRFRKASDAVIFESKLRLSDAQLTIAREHGFPSWIRLKRHIEKPTLVDRLDLPQHERIEDAAFRDAVDLLDTGSLEGLRAHLQAHPQLVHQHIVFEGGNYFSNPTLLEFSAENPIRRGSLPTNIVEVMKIILEAGAKDEQAALDETLGLVASGQISRECGVQVPMIDLLCDYGANPDNAMLPALMHGEFEAVNALIRRGAIIDLDVAAAMGRTEDARELLGSASRETRHRALSSAASFGHTEIVRMLLDAGEDPNRYNLPGTHSHTTPLHQAALLGHEEVVRLLVERGARLDIKDILFQATPADWAKHAGKTQIETYLRTKQ
jgi:hypothetical protein